MSSSNGDSAVLELNDLMFHCPQSSSTSPSSWALLTCEPADRASDHMKGMSSCKLQLHCTLYISLNHGVMGANPNTDRKGPPSQETVCQSYSTELGEGTFVYVWILRGVMVSKAMFGRKCTPSVAGQVNGATKPSWLSQNYFLINAQRSSSKPVKFSLFFSSLVE